jgi:catechol 2,3-dioxygenase-like lactoylglutathione lyase family enzyme
MKHALVHVALVVPDYDEAIEHYRSAFGFEPVEDRAMGGSKRWVLVAPPGGRGAALLLARAANEAQASRIGNQTGGRVFLFLHTDDFEASLERALAHGAQATESPRDEAYGRVIVLLDRYGNKWDLIEPRAAP